MATTLKTVAESAGVSIRTAGRALRGDGPVKPEVATRVRQAAQRLNYVPNAAARNLRRQTSRIVGVISGDDFHCEAHQNKLRLIEQQLRRHAFHTLLGALPDGQHELEQLLREWTGVVDHVIFLGWPTSWDAEALHNFPMQFLFLDCGGNAFGFHRLLTERSSGVEAAVGELVRAGRIRIGHVRSGQAMGRSEGFERAIAAAGPTVTGFSIDVPGLELADGYQAGAQALSLGCDALFFDTDRMALGFYRYAHDHRIAIPGAVAVAGFDDDSAGAYAIPTLTTVAHPAADTVGRAIQLILSPEAPAPEAICFPTRLISRESTISILQPGE